MAVYSKANQKHRFDKSYPGGYVKGVPYRLVWHSTESKGWSSYQGGAVAPHFTIDPQTGVVHQHFDTARPARALEHRANTIDTNNMRAIQIEVIAYSDKALAKKVGGLFIGDFTEAHYARLRTLARWIEAKCNVQARHTVHTKDYPASYGDNNGVRLSDAAWKSYNGHCEHQNVPHNNHGDAGALDLARLMPPVVPKPATGGDDVQVIVREKGSVHCYIGNGINRRHLVGGADVTNAQMVFKTGAVRDVPKGTLDQYGVLVGPDVPAGA